MQIQLTEAQLSKLREIARAQGRSLSDLIRESVDRYVATERPIDREEQKRRALAVIGKYQSGVSDLGSNHDKYLDEAYGEWE